MENSKKVMLPQGYIPTENEEFMSPTQVEYFRQKILNWRKTILEGAHETMENLKNDTIHEADINDQASAEIDKTIELQKRERERLVLQKIDDALSRINEGSYGYCEKTGNPIGLARLEARPIATLCIEAQERHERKAKMYRKSTQQTSHI